MLLKSVSIIVGLLFITPIAHAEDGKFVYNKICYYCHDDGLVGSPMIGDTAEWAKRRQKGIDLLYLNTFVGTGQMMERQARQGFTDIDIKNAVDYLIEQGK